jgi:tRNA modification GTPase
MDTIFAVSSGAPPAAIAVLRLSGPGAFDAAEALAGTLPEPRRAGLRALHDPATATLLDRALILTFPGPNSASGEDLVELHLHGGRAVVRAVEAALGAIEGLRPAEPGEFTRRALINGRLDLSEAEGLGDLLMAETEAQRRVAVRTAEGGVRRQVEAWTQRLLQLGAQVEAQLDHSDEDDVAAGVDTIAKIHAGAAALARDIALLTGRPPVERLRDGLRVVLAGPPNAGKSTLFNTLAGREAAIVSAVAGTTRDRIEAPVVRDGVAWLLIDTAGLAEATADPIEAIGIDRARAALEEADIVLWLGDDSPPVHPAVLWLQPRADHPTHPPVRESRLSVSAKTGSGLQQLWARLDTLGRELLPPPDQLALNQRQRELANRASRALASAALQHDILLIAEELRGARRAFDAITGRADVEAMLDALFSRFCIGK